MPLNFSSVYFVDKNKTKHTISTIYRSKKGEGITTAWSSSGGAYDENATPASYFQFTLLADNTYSVRAAEPSIMPSVVILPAIYNGLPVTVVEDNAFLDLSTGYPAKVMQKVTIPSGYTTIGKQAFIHESNLVGIYIPATVTTIGNLAFAGCERLTIYCEAESKPAGWIDESNGWNSGDRPVIWGFNRFVFTYDSNAQAYVVSAADASTLSGEITIPHIYDGLAVDTISSFAGSGITKVNIPSSIKKIFPNAFNGCTSLATVAFDDGSSLTHIGEGAFRGCSALTYISYYRIPWGVTTISSYAFEGCSALTEIRIPTSVTIMGSKAFDNCNNLTINCYATEQPSGWASDWNPDNRPVTWGYTG